jgi:sulfoxide reductase heme-binding subunit YedZ
VNAKTISFVIKPLVFLLALIPLGVLVWNATHDNLGVDPAKALVDFLGLWALRFLWITLAITPLRRLTNLTWLLRFRRMLGLYAWFYATLHVAGYLVFILQLQWHKLVDDIIKRPYIMVGFAAFMLLLPLGLTSFNYAIKKLGKNWQKLHQLIYVIAVLVALHFLWVARSNIGEQLMYIVLLVGMLLIRVYFDRTKKRL